MGDEFRDGTLTFKILGRLSIEKAHSPFSFSRFSEKIHKGGKFFTFLPKDCPLSVFGILAWAFPDPRLRSGRENFHFIFKIYQRTRKFIIFFAFP
jgi:hypothetical protein